MIRQPALFQDVKVKSFLSVSEGRGQKEADSMSLLWPCLGLTCSSRGTSEKTTLELTLGDGAHG